MKRPRFILAIVLTLTVVLAPLFWNAVTDHVGTTESEVIASQVHLGSKFEETSSRLSAQGFPEVYPPDNPGAHSFRIRQFWTAPTVCDRVFTIEMVVKNKVVVRILPVVGKVCM